MSDAMTEENEALFCAAVRAGDLEAVSELLARTRPGTVNRYLFGPKQSALTVAVHRGDLALVRLLVEEGKADIVCWFGGSSMPLLCLASWKGHADVVDYLISFGVYTGYVDRERRTPLIYAAIHGHLAIVRSLLAAGPERAGIDTKDSGGMCALMHAYKEDHADIVRELLLVGGAEVPTMPRRKEDLAVYRGNVECMAILEEAEARYRSLVEAVLEGTLAEVTKLLDPPSPGLLRRAEPEDGLTVLMLAASKGRYYVARLLIQSGALLNQQDARGRTALMEACAQGRMEVARLLLEEGADAYVVDKSGKDAFQLACRRGDSTTFKRLWQKYTSSTHIYIKEEELLESAYASDRLEVFQMCMDEGMNPPYKLYPGEEAGRSTEARAECSSVIEAAFERRHRLVSAAETGDVSALQGLLEGEGDKRRLLRGRDTSGRTPLTAAASANQVEAAKYLIQRGAEVMRCDGQRYRRLFRANMEMYTPLRRAAKMGHVEMIHCLCAAGAGPWAVPSIQQGSEKCAVVEAVSHGHLEAVTALLSYDTARPNCGRGMRVALDNVCNTWHVGIARKLQSHCNGSAGFNPMILERADDDDQFEIMAELLLPQTEETRASIGRYLRDEESGPPSPEADLMIQLALRDDLYLLHKARTIFDANSPRATPPPCLASRALPPHQPIPRVTVASPAALVAGKRASCDKEAEDSRRGLLAAVAQFVIADLKLDLFVELSHMLRPVQAE